MEFIESFHLVLLSKLKRFQINRVILYTTGFLEIASAVFTIIAGISEPFRSFLSKNINLGETALINYLILANIALIAFGLNFFRHFYKQRIMEGNKDDIAENLHRFSEVLREYSTSQNNRVSQSILASEKKRLCEAANIHLLEISKQLFGPNIQVIIKGFDANHQNQIRTISAKGKEIGSKDVTKRYRDNDYCYLFLKAASKIAHDRSMLQYVILSAITGKKTPLQFKKIWRDATKIDDLIGSHLRKTTKSAENCWQKLAKRVEDRNYRSLFRVHINDAEKETYGLFLIASKDPMCFHNIPRWKIETLLALVDQLFPIVINYPFPDPD